MSGDFGSLDSYLQQYEGERNRRLLTAQAELTKDRTEGMEALNLGAIPGVEKFTQGARALGLGTEADTLIDNATDYLRGKFLDGSRYLANNLDRFPNILRGGSAGSNVGIDGTEMQDFGSQPPRVGTTSDIDATFQNPIYEGQPTGEASLGLPDELMEGYKGLTNGLSNVAKAQLPDQADAFTKNALQVASDAKQSLIKSIAKAGAKSVLGDGAEDLLDTAPEELAEDPLGGIAELVGGGLLALATGGLAGDLMGQHVDLGKFPSIPMPTFTPQGQL